MAIWPSSSNISGILPGDLEWDPKQANGSRECDVSGNFGRVIFIEATFSLSLQRRVGIFNGLYFQDQRVQDLDWYFFSKFQTSMGLDWESSAK